MAVYDGLTEQIQSIFVAMWKTGVFFHWVQYNYSMCKNVRQYNLL